MGIGSFITMATEAMGTRVRMAHHKRSLNWSKRSCKYERNFEGTTRYIEDCKYHGAQDPNSIIKMEWSTPLTQILTSTIVQNAFSNPARPHTPTQTRMPWRTSLCNPTKIHTMRSPQHQPTLHPRTLSESPREVSHMLLADSPQPILFCQCVHDRNIHFRCVFLPIIQPLRLYIRAFIEQHHVLQNFRLIVSRCIGHTFLARAEHHYVLEVVGKGYCRRFFLQQVLQATTMFLIPFCAETRDNQPSQGIRSRLSIQSGRNDATRYAQRMRHQNHTRNAQCRSVFFPHRRQDLLMEISLLFLQER